LISVFLLRAHTQPLEKVALNAARPQGRTHPRCVDHAC